VLKNKLNRVIKALKNLLDLERNQRIQEYLSKLSATFETTLCEKLLRD
jgi:flagellin-specific chaperone FliS